MKEAFFKTLAALLFCALAANVQSAVLYSIGDPTDEEQLYVEWINRARANPAAEGLRLAQSTDADIVRELRRVNTNLLISQFGAIPSAPPLSINNKLTIAARLHTGHMFTNIYQGHQGPGELDMVGRILAQAYDFSTIGENVFSFARSVEHGHAGFNVDWGTNASTGGSVGGMQNPAGHRINIHSPNFKEIGVGVILGSRTNGSARVGPQLVTQDFGTRFGITPLITGVSYFDINGNNFYDIGEGIGNVNVSVQGSVSGATTVRSGGYSVPVTTNGSYRVSFTGENFAGSNVNVSVQNLENRKVDLVLPYIAPTTIYSGNLVSGQNNLVGISIVPFATSYLVHQARLLAYNGVEGAETTNNITINATAGYNVVDSAVKASGNFSFHLAHAAPEPQIVTFNNQLRLRSNSSVTFQSRLGWATASQVAKVQITINGGATWQTVWSRAGTEDEGQTTFSQVSINLSAFANEVANFRLIYDFSSGSFFNQTQPDVGWYVDDFRVTSADELSGTVATEVTEPSFTFAPATAGNYAISIQPRVAGRLFPAESRQVTVIDGSLTARITGIERMPNGSTRLTIASGTPTIGVETRSSVSANWSPVDGITVQSLANSTYQATIPASTSQTRLFRLRLGL